MFAEKIYYFSKLNFSIFGPNIFNIFKIKKIKTIVLRCGTWDQKLKYIASKDTRIQWRQLNVKKLSHK